MAVLTASELAELRRNTSAASGTVTWDKGQINAALQAIEDDFENRRASVINAIDAATAPFAFTGAQKKQIIRHWLAQRSHREGA